MQDPLMDTEDDKVPRPQTDSSETIPMLEEETEAMLMDTDNMGPPRPVGAVRPTVESPTGRTQVWADTQNQPGASRQRSMEALEMRIRDAHEQMYHLMAEQQRMH